jgi:hypothetical protein
MGFIRRLIIATAEWTSMLSIFVWTYAGGVIGRAVFAKDDAYLTKAGTAAFGSHGTTGIGFIVGAALAFIVAATTTAAFFCLIEIAQNTRRQPEPRLERHRPRTEPPPLQSAR